VTLNGDGTGTYSFAIGVVDKLIATQPQFVSDMTACAATVKAQAGSSSMVDSGGYSTWTFTWQFSNLNQLNTLLASNTSFCPIPSSNVPATTTANDTLSIAAHAHFLTTTYVLTGHLSFLLSPTGTTQDPTAAALLADAYSSFSITMPGWVSSESAGGTVQGSTVTYRAHNGDTLDFQVVGEGLNIPALLVIGGGGLLGLGLLVLVVLLFRRPSAAERERAAAEVPLAPTGYAD
jgi:hypothetical protein